MELRGYSHLHYIQAIKRGLVIKSLSVDAFGMPEAAFKNIKDIYEAGNSEHHDSASTFLPEDEFEGLQFAPKRVKHESPCLPTASRSPIYRCLDTFKFNRIASDEGDSKDHSFGNMTLKQIKESCKARKRKLENYFDTSEETSENCFPLEQAKANLEPEGDENDLNEPLSSWKYRISKNKKGKRKCIQNYISNSPQNATSTVEYEKLPSDRNFSQHSGDKLAAIVIKTEVNDPDYSNCRTMICVTDSSPECNEQVDSCGVEIDKVHVTASEYLLEIDVSSSSRKELCSVVNEASYGHMECVDPELNDFDNSSRQTMIRVADSSLDCDEQVGSCGVAIDNVHVTASECLQEADASMSSKKEQCCVLNEASYRYVECVDPEFNDPDYSDHPTLICATDSSSDCNEQVGSCGVIIDKEQVTASGCCPATDVSTSSIEEQCFAVNEASSWFKECVNPESVPDTSVTHREIITVNTPEITSYQCPDSSVPEVENEGRAIHPILNDVSPEPISITKDPNSDIYHNSQSYSSTNDISWPSSSSSSKVQVLDMAIDDRLQCMENIEGGEAYLFEDGSKGDLPSDLKASTVSIVSHCSSSWSSDSCLSPNSCLVSVADGSPLAEENQHCLSACTGAARSCAATIQPFDASDELTAPAGLGDNDNSELQRTPERLLSTRKAISPTSQEKLCKAMTSIELNDDKHSECKGELPIGKQTENKAEKAEGCTKIRRAEVSMYTKQLLRKPKYDKKGPHTKGVLKGSHISSASSSFSTGCTSTQSLSQSAIAFSQRQMQDIESLTTKLTGELSSMKDVVNEILQFETCPATSSKHNIDKVTIAIKSATKVEETARKWLSLMSRDCNRFCKIMKMTEIGSTAAENVVQKERKITFADEAGGKLCHVKVFENDMASQLESNDIDEIAA